MSGCNRRLCCRFLNGPRLFFTGSRHGRRLDHHAGGRVRHHYNGSSGCNCACGRLGDDSACRRPRSNRGSRRWRSDDWRSRPWLRNNLARFWTCRRRCGLHWCCRRDGCRCVYCWRGWFGWRSGCRPCRQMRMARPFFLFVLLCQHCLQHIARFGDVRQVNLRDDGLCRVARRCRTPVRSRSRILR